MSLQGQLLLRQQTMQNLIQCSWTVMIFVATTIVQERALVSALISSVWETLKIEHSTGNLEGAAVPFW